MASLSGIEQTAPGGPDVLHARAVGSSLPHPLQGGECKLQPSDQDPPPTVYILPRQQQEPSGQTRYQIADIVHACEINVAIESRNFISTADVAYNTTGTLQYYHYRIFFYHNAKYKIKPEPDSAYNGEYFKHKPISYKFCKWKKNSTQYHF